MVKREKICFDVFSSLLKQKNKRKQKKTNKCFKNGRCRNIVRSCKSDESDFHHERRSCIDELQQLILLLGLENKTLNRFAASFNNHLRQSPQTRRFFVTWISDVVGFATKFHAIASFSLCPQRADSVVSSSFNGRVIHDESYS